MNTAHHTVTANYHGNDVYVSSEIKLDTPTKRILLLSVAPVYMSERAARRIAAACANDDSLTNVKIQEDAA